MDSIVVVGASLAGVSPVGALRQQGHDGQVILIGDEADRPYARPPLSKAVLQGTQEPGDTTLPALDCDVELILGDGAVELNVAEHRVGLHSGRSTAFDHLVIATGSRPRTIRPDARGETVLRSLRDCVSLRRTLREERPSVLILGGGFLGMEVASVCRALGLPVTVVDITEPLERALGPVLSARFRQAAADAGARLLSTEAGFHLLGEEKLTGIRLLDGTVIEADLVITAIGDVPNTEWLSGSGLETAGDSVLIDDRCAAAPGIYAVGDVTAWRDPDGTVRRRPHYSQAIDQARIAAHALLGGTGPAPRIPPPYFWTDMFQLYLRICGEIPVGTAPEIIEGDLEAGSALLGWKVAGQPVAAAALNYKIPVPRLRNLITTRPLSVSP